MIALFQLFTLKQGKKKPLSQLRIKGLKVAHPEIESLYLITDYQYFIFVFNTGCVPKPIF